MTSLTKKEAVLTFHWLQDVTTCGIYYELFHTTPYRQFQQQNRGWCPSAFATPKLALSDGRADIDTTMFSDFFYSLSLFQVVRRPSFCETGACF